jgi:hypothetical protein
MPDELDALQRFRDETPGPSTDAWARAWTAIAAAKSEEEPAARRHGWIPGRRLQRRGPGQRRTLVIATGSAVAAAVAALLAVGLSNLPGTRGTGAQIETAAFVTRVEHALSKSGQRNVVGYARTVYPPGYRVQLVASGGLRVFPNYRASSPWSVGYLVRWSYQGTLKVSAFTAAGHRIFDLGITAVHGTLTSTGVSYRSGTWWRGAAGPAPAGNGPAPAQCGPDVQLGAGGWPAFIRHALGCGEYTPDGRQLVDGIDAIKLTGKGLGALWVNPATYLPVRALFTFGSEQIQTDFRWLSPTPANLAQLSAPVPAGFRQVPPPSVAARR